MNPQTFFDYFERLTDAPNAVARLREMILQLAVQGKLVEQDERDEPASTLPEKIKAGSKSKQKDLYKEEANENFILPNGWTWMRLDEIGRWALGSGFPTIEQGHTDKPFLFCKVSDMNLPGNEKWITKANNTIDEDVVKRLRVKVHPVGTVIFPKIGGAIATNKRRVLAVPAAIDNNCLGITPHKFCDSDWIYLLLSSINLADYQSGTSVPALSQGTIGAITTGVPPLEEQKRIVAKVDELMRLCDVLEREQHERRISRLRINRDTLDQLLAARVAAEFRTRWQSTCDHFATLTATPDLLGKLRQTVLQLAVQGRLTQQDSQEEPATSLLRREKEQLVKENPVKPANQFPPIKLSEPSSGLPSGWAWARISDICDVGTGSTPLTSNPEYYEDGDIAWVTSAATSQAFIYNVDTYITQAAVRDYRLRIYPPETLIVALYGQGKTRGQISQLKIAAAINQACAAINFFKKFEDMAEYVRLFFEKSYVELRALAAGGAQPNLNLSKIKESIIPVPPLEEQKRIVAAVNRLMALCDELEANLRRAEVDGERLLRAAVRSLLASVSENSAAEAVALVVQ
jgi:type I restriction enzyme, S subunit